MAVAVIAAAASLAPAQIAPELYFSDQTSAPSPTTLTGPNPRAITTYYNQFLQDRWVFVCGEVNHTPASSSMVVWGYDHRGDQLPGFPAEWPPGGGVHTGHYRAVTVHMGDGGVYVAGVGPGDGTGLDTFLVRFDTQGNFLWKGQYDHQKLDDVPVRIIDEIGACWVAVVGTTQTERNGSDYFIAVFDRASGDLLGEMTIDGGFGLQDTARDAGHTHLATEDPNFGGGGDPVFGRVYITGTSHHPQQGTDFLTVAVMVGTDCAELPVLTEVWRDRYHHESGPQMSVEEAASLHVIHNLGVVVTGSSQADPLTGSSKFDYLTILYHHQDATPNQRRWVSRWNGLGNSHDIPRRVHSRQNPNADDQHYIYVTGGSYYEGLGFDIATIAINPDPFGVGNVVWEHYHRAANINAEDFGMDVYAAAGGGWEEDDQGGVYVVGKQTDASGNAAYVIYRLRRSAIHPLGQYFWPFPDHVQVIDTPGFDEPTTIAVIERYDGNGLDRSEIYVTGRAPAPWHVITARYRQCPIQGGCETWWE